MVDWALADGLYVMLNVHHDSWQWISNMPTDHDNVLARFNATWTQIAAAFRDDPRQAALRERQRAAVHRQLRRRPEGSSCSTSSTPSFHSDRAPSGGNNATRLLVLPTLHTRRTRPAWTTWPARSAALNDPNLVATVHYYGYWPFSVNIAGGTTSTPTRRTT